MAAREKPRRVDPAKPSPNQTEKRRQIVEAARRVLLRDGIAACTSRAIADESPLTKSAVHYYFGTMDELVDAAMASLLEDFLTTLRKAYDSGSEPADRLTAVIAAYLGAFSGVPGATALWFGYVVAASQTGNRKPLVETEEAIMELLADLLEDAGAEDAQTRARALFSYLTGAVLRQELGPVKLAELRPEIEALLGLQLAPA